MQALIDRGKPVLLEAVRLDGAGNKKEAIAKYREGIAILMDAIACNDASPSAKESLTTTVAKYMKRAETLRDETKVKFEYVDRLLIDAGTIGHGYDKIFERCLDDTLKEVSVTDAYIMAHHQILNFIRFCELCVLKAKNLKMVRLRTQKGDSNEAALLELKASLQTRGIGLEITFDSELHDRQIRFENGWLVKVGRGLDYFRNPGRYALGTCDLNLRQCHETAVDFFRFKRP